MYGRSVILRSGAWLALLAMVMVFIAPAISKSLMQTRACEHHTSMPAMDMSHEHHKMADMTDMPEPATCHDGIMMHSLLMPDTGQSPMEQIACGYCQLLVHLPVILFIFAVLLRLLALLARWIPFTDYRCPRIFRAWTPQRARAPPLSSFHFSL